MQGLISLPNELQYRILQFIEPRDLEAFICSCRHNHSLAKDAYNEYKKGYNGLHYGNLVVGVTYNFDKTLKDREDPRLLVQSILVWPHMVFWPTVLQAGELDDWDQKLPPADLESHINQISLRAQPSIRNEFRKQFNTMASQFYPVAPALRAEMNDIPSLPFTPKNAICLLLTLLPNLKSLTLSTWSQSEVILHDIIRRVAEANRDPASPIHGKALTNLQDVSMIHWDTEMGVDIESYLTFAMLPSMRSLYGTQIVGEEEFSWPTGFPRRSSSVTTIEITMSAVSADCFKALFGGFTALKHFKYEYGGSIIGDAPYEPAGIIDALRLHACHSLESMDIQGLEETYGDYGEEEVAGLLHDFVTLKTIRLEHFLFRKLESVDVSSEEDHPVGCRVIGVGPSWSEDPPGGVSQLVNVLPASIECVTLIQATTSERTTDLLKGLLEFKETKIPRLRKLAFEYEDPLTDEMKENLKSIGIEIWAGNRDSYEVSPI
ncbi:MAG: hypothetical protein L6R41_007663 [Letrouitia leprolyta]|nr:MAG: hypothetical protein L6R41_007663 [Letrouitia leprolyta]